MIFIIDHNRTIDQSVECVGIKNHFQQTECLSDQISELVKT